MPWIRHAIVISLVLAILGLFSFQSYVQKLAIPADKTIIGVTYSPRYATYLGLDARQGFLQIVQQLHIKQVRLPIYWSEIEPKEGRYDFQDLDWYVQQAEKNQVELILVTGFKVPRWPECYPPSWLKYSDQQFPQQQLHNMLKTVISRYDHSPAVVAWQIENEPQFAFGECKNRTTDSLTVEVHFVRTLTQKPIVMTDTGEFSSWRTGMRLSDIFGSTLYRDAHFPPVGHLYFPIQPWFYHLKSEMARYFFAPNNQKTIIVELQGEAWVEDGIAHTSIDQQLSLFPLEILKDNIKYAQKAGFDTIYVWGIEWYLYLAQNGHPEFLNFVQSLQKTQN